MPDMPNKKAKVGKVPKKLSEKARAEMELQEVLDAFEVERGRRRGRPIPARRGRGGFPGVREVIKDLLRDNYD